MQLFISNMYFIQICFAFSIPSIILNNSLIEGKELRVKSSYRVPIIL